MAGMMELLRQSDVPLAVIRSAAKGALSLPPGEMLEVLVYLSGHPSVSQDAQNTLKKWDASALGKILSNPQTSREVLNYFLLPGNCQPTLLAALCDNPVVSAEDLSTIVKTASREQLDVLLRNRRARQSASIRQLLLSNPLLTESERAELNQNAAAPGTAPAQQPAQPVEAEAEQWIVEHAPEIAAEQNKKFSLIGGLDGNSEATTEINDAVLATAAAEPQQPERISVLQKLARMTVGERVQAAVKGNKDERSILIRDGARIVSLAVLASPKLSEAEVENFSSLKNVQESVLREISRNRKFAKNYVVTKNLCNNPRTPIDVSLALLKNLQIMDLKILSQSKNVPDTLRKMAHKLFTTRMSPSGRSE